MRKLLKPFVEDVDELEREEKIMKKKPYVLLIHDDTDEGKMQKMQMQKKNQKREKKNYSSKKETTRTENEKTRGKKSR